MCIGAELGASLAEHGMGVRVLRRHAGNAGSARLGMRTMPAGGGPRLEAGGRNASDSFGGGSGMPALLSCPASLASAHAGGDTRAPPGPGATPGISAPCMPGPPLTCRQPASRISAPTLPNSCLWSAGVLTRVYCKLVLLSIASLDAVEVGVGGWGGPAMLLQVLQQPLQLLVSE